MRERAELILFPPNPADHITDWLREIGPTVSGAMGEAAIGWQDLAAWEHLTGIELDAWEARTIRSLSQEYLAQRHAATEPACPPPYSGTRQDVGVVRDKVTAQFAAMARSLPGAPAADAPPPARRKKPAKNGASASAPARPR